MEATYFLGYFKSHPDEKTIFIDDGNNHLPYQCIGSEDIFGKNEVVKLTQNFTMKWLLRMIERNL